VTDDRWRRVKALFQDAVQRATEERDAFVASAARLSAKRMSPLCKLEWTPELRPDSGRRADHAPVDVVRIGRRDRSQFNDLWRAALRENDARWRRADPVVGRCTSISMEGTMSDASVSPADPVWRLHHANFDRLSWVWYNSPQGHRQNPPLTGTDQVMEPRMYAEADVRASLRSVIATWDRAGDV
jgi:hypothetical protein